ncbi:MAG: DNA polymerase/3'-5' exonuclease PolX [Patescibacteria group bacterium]|nr:DNA polymerase/3'-5' exonuclease PolX [Patescibacteria group bacterium]
MTKAQELAKIFLEFAYYHEMNGVAFKPRAYEIASESMAGLGDEVEAAWRKGGVKELKKLPSLGQSTAEKVDEFLRTGHVKEYEQMKKRFPVDIWGLSRIEGLGPKHIKELYRHLKVKNLNDLKRALQSGKIKKLPRWGEKSQDKLERQLKLMEASAGRQLLGYILPAADQIVKELSKVPGVMHCTYAGSIRRRQETIGDIDLLATSKNPERVMDVFVNLPQVETIHEKGKTRSSVRLKIGIDADLRVVPDKVYGATLQYFTGDKKHNVMLREYALSKGFTLNEYGLFTLVRRKGKPLRRYFTYVQDDKKGALVVCKTEEEIYKKLKMDTPPPELRVGGDEIEAAQKHKLPNLIPYGSIKGDLQVQTTWSDGALGIKEMAEEAKKRGLTYMAVTDHTKSLAFINGLNEKRLAQQGKEIDKLNKALKGFTILKGTECDIHKDGSLDLSDKALAKLDWVGISIHSNFKLSRAEQTKRLVKAMSNPYVDCVFHPTCRLIGKREPIDLDMDEVLAAAKKYKVALEINSFPERSDLRDVHVRMAIKAGVKIVINSDAHAPEHFDFLPLGEAIARRGWATKADVLNTKSAKEMMACEAKKHR